MSSVILHERSKVAQLLKRYLKRIGISSAGLNLENSAYVHSQVGLHHMQKRYATKHKQLGLDNIKISGKTYTCDDWTNVTEKILSYVGKNLHVQKDHPICIIKEAIVQHFYNSYVKARRVPLFAVFDNLAPVVTVQQNFDSLLIPQNHVSRKKSENYYVNKNTVLRAHTSAHEHELIKSGLDAYLMVGDVYRRDTIDATHFPVFHQLEGVRLFNSQQLFSKCEGASADLTLFEVGDETKDKQSCHTLETSKLLEFNLKQTIEDCIKDIFGKEAECKWVDAYFPFTHPSYELEIKYNDEWIEMLGCGILRQEILNQAGACDQVAWAFGLGLERLAMKLFNIPDIRYMWTEDESFLAQFRCHSDFKSIKFKPIVSKQPALVNDVAFWVPTDFTPNDFYDLVRSVDDGLVQTITLIDQFTHSSGKQSHCYRLFYRHVSRALTQAQVNEVHGKIKRAAVKHLNVEGRW
uniref:phenylalanine--tRNA ligase, mitochondrial n=1 Tax=Ciona intestinalis TaxID=7719 RepID=UPI000521B5D2|nr:phenylalanine--tRNA ligase, mitochondrial [Ciona intestinalis]XP_026689404.1 phenylalanine--tRNA ligase, mitochondrial [Ciona intestinalis]|eukprot:XP_009857978.1 phenylalanine--tRNA ligase, mitochondrial [Ciona intestinalis]